MAQQNPRADAFVCVAIVNYRTGAHLKRCVAALEVQTFRNFEVIILDNAPQDPLLEHLDPSLPRFRMIFASKNLGFAKANNVIARATEAQWLATLNPDAFPAPDWLERLAEATARYPEDVMFGSTQLDANDVRRLDGAGDVYHASGIAWRGGQGHLTPARLADGEVFAPCAAAAMYRRDVFLAIGGFEENYFCYFEDVDLAFRLRLAGYRSIQIGRAVVQHVGSASSGPRSDFAVYHGTRNRLWTFVRDMPGPLFWLLLPAHVLISTLFLAPAAFRGTLSASLRGYRDGILGLGAVWKTRRRIQRSRKASVRQIASAFTWSPVALFKRQPDIRPLQDPKSRRGST